LRLPDFEPMLATRWPAPFEDEDWWFEVKWDGYRAVVGSADGKIRARSRRGLDLIGHFPELARLDIPDGVVIDGEITVFDDEGRPSFSLLQRRTGFGGTGTGDPSKTFWRVEADENRTKGRRPTALTRQVSADDGTNPMTDRNLAPIARPTSRVICGAETFGDNTLDSKLGDRLEESHPMSRCGVWHDDGRRQAQVV